MSTTDHIRLYRSPAHCQHWVVYSERYGWTIYPAKPDGWAERRPYLTVSTAGLHQVPLWMAFHTGLLEAVVARAA